MLSLSNNNQADVVEAFYSTSRYLDDLLNIYNPDFELIVSQIYPTELQLNKAFTPFVDLDLSITNSIVSTKSNDTRDNFNFEIGNFSFLGGDVPRSPFYGLYISQLVRFARVCSNEMLNSCHIKIAFMSFLVTATKNTLLLCISYSFNIQIHFLLLYWLVKNSGEAFSPLVSILFIEESILILK